MPNKTDKWAPTLMRKLLDPAEMGRTAIVEIWEGGTTSRGEPIGGQPVQYTVNISPPEPNSRRQFVGDDVSQEGRYITYSPEIDRPVDFQLGMVLQVAYPDKTEAFTIRTIERLASGDLTIGWRLTGDM